jgi:demethylmenaquinone methyltransferase/2-methoxy-6-polyprenyl-1,4-benzoquinol methylase
MTDRARAAAPSEPSAAGRPIRVPAGKAAPTGNAVPAAEVRTMFDRIAPIYDRMNTLMTAGLDARWRRDAVRATGLSRGMSAVDVACGSGALTRVLAARVGPRGRVRGVDVSEAMLREAERRRRPGDVDTYMVGDALALPLDDASVDAAAIAFGLRNVTDYRRCLDEMARVTRPGGRVVVLEIATPSGGLGRWIARLWFQRLVPLIGRLAGGGGAYRYLPASVRRYPSPEEIAAQMRAAGLAGVRWRRLALGMVTLHAGRRV